MFGRFLFSIALLLASHTALAEPIAGRGTWETTLYARDLDADGVPDAYYDSSHGITWLADWNLFGHVDPDLTWRGRMTWADANFWAANLAIGSHDSWRLPTMTGVGGADCIRTACAEMYSLFNITLGNDNMSQSAPWNTGPFANLVRPEGNSFFWYSTGFNYGCGGWRTFQTDGGGDLGALCGELSRAFAVAVADGDVGAPLTVVEPSTNFLLLGAALALLATARRRQPQ